MSEMKIGDPIKKSEVQGRTQERSSKYDDLLEHVRGLKKNQALPVKATLADRREHQAFRDRIAAAVRRGTEDMENATFSVRLTDDGVAIVRS